MDGDQKPQDLDPELSKGALKLRKRKLDTLPWSHSGKHPGNRLFWQILLIMFRTSWKYMFRRKYVDNIPKYEGGRIISSIHINGLVDPVVIISTQKRRVISMGRHDIMTMPLIGWFARRMGSQPVIRKAEIKRGVASPDYATKINHRSLLTMSNCISSGYNAIVMPEGKSHQDTKLHKFKTGIMRFAINSASISNEKNLPLPALQPVGLHYRCHHKFRTDLFVEYIEPIIVDPTLDDYSSKQLIEGKWIEPPKNDVIRLRNKLFEQLQPITPDSPDWETYRTFHLIGHILANKKNKPLQTYRDEVLAAREIREKIRKNSNAEQLNSPLKQASNILEEHNLDGRSLTKDGIKEENSSISAIIGLILMILSSPISIPSSGMQAFLALYLGDRTDEGIDARTTYHMMAAIFSPIIFWPPLALIFAYNIVGSSPLIIIYILLLMTSFHVSNLIFLLGYDLWNDFLITRRTRKLANSDEGNTLLSLISKGSSNLDVLK